MYLPTRDSEHAGLVKYIEQQLDALRASVHGLTEDEARSTPCRADLSLAGILKHTLQRIRQSTLRLGGEPDAPPEPMESIDDYRASFHLGPDESVADLLAHWDLARVRFLAVVPAADPTVEVVEPPAPWSGWDSPVSAHLRFHLVHLVEELARQAGHADILREEIDGVTVRTLVHTRARTAPNAYFTPYEADEGTLTY